MSFLAKNEIKIFPNIKRFFSKNKQFKVDDLKNIFSKYHRPNSYNEVISLNPNLEKMKRASVLIPITFKEETDSSGKRVQSSYITLTKRSETLSSFKGEVCFIGGNVDQEDQNEVETAIRESQEEAGIERRQLDLIAHLCPVVTSHGSLVTPVVAYFDQSNFKPLLNKNEVELIFEMSTLEFLSSKNHIMKKVKHKSDEFNLHFFEHKIGNCDLVIAHLTAFIAILTSSMLHSRLPDFEIDSQLKLTKENIHRYMETYLIEKSEGFVKDLVNRQSKNKPFGLY